MFRLLYEAVPPAGAPVALDALLALGLVCAFIVVWGLHKIIDAFVRALFGTVTGAVAWIPFAGKVAAHNIHRVEQKITHALGSAEQAIDTKLALAWHQLAQVNVHIAREIYGGAVATWHLAQQAKAFVRQRDVTHEVQVGVRPVKARAINAGKTAAQARHETHAVSHSVATGVYPRLKAQDHAISDVLSRDVAALRTRTKALEHDWHAVFKWMQRYKTWILGATFVGAVDLALRKLGGGWIRCKNWRNIGKTVCRLPTQLIEALLGLGLAFGVVIDPLATAHLAADVTDGMDSLIRKIAD